MKLGQKCKLMSQDDTAIYPLEHLDRNKIKDGNYREWAGGAARICCALRIFVRPLIIEPFLHRSSVWHSPELETTLVFPNSYTVFHSQIVIPRELRITAFQVLVEMDDTHKYFQQVSVKKKNIHSVILLIWSTKLVASELTSETMTVPAHGRLKGPGALSESWEWVLPFCS